MATRLSDLKIGQYSVLSGWLGVSLRPKRLVYCDQPFRSHIKGSVVGAAGQAHCAPHTIHIVPIGFEVLNGVTAALRKAETT